MKLTGVELRRISLPLVSPFRTSFGTETTRDALLVRAVSTEAEGWGECVAMTGTAVLVGVRRCRDRRTATVLRARDGRRWIPLSRWRRRWRSSTDIGWRRRRWRPPYWTPNCEPRGDRWPVNSARYTTVCRAEFRSGSWTRSGELLDAVGGYLDEGYLRIKLKIQPGWDIEPVAAVRERFGDILLQVDANTAYSVSDARHLSLLDPFDLLLIEQPLDEEDILGHAELARQLKTPICLDESITSARSAAAAITLGACSIINIKPGRVGGYLEVPPNSRRLRGPRHPRLVRRHARNRPRPSRQHRPGRPPRLHPPRRHLSLQPLLPNRHHHPLHPPKRPPPRPHHPRHRPRPPYPPN